MFHKPFCQSFGASDIDDGSAWTDVRSAPESAGLMPADS